MAILRIYPAWQTTPQFDDVEITPGQSFREIIVARYGICPPARSIEGSLGLRARDRQGQEFDLGGTPTLADERHVVALSLRPIFHPESFFEARGSAVSLGSGAQTTEPPPPQPAGWRYMTDDERLLASELAGLGFCVERAGLDPEAIAEAFPVLPRGYGTTSSPYRFLMASGLVISELSVDALAKVDAVSVGLVERLADKLQLHTPDAIDFRLHLFVQQPDGLPYLRDYLVQGAKPMDRFGLARVHRGWSRVVVHPYQSEEERLARMVNAARKVAVERLDPELLRNVQRSCADFAVRYTDGGDEAWLDHQAVVTIQPMEETLRVRAERRLLSRFLGVFSGTAGAGISRSLADDILMDCGLLPNPRTHNPEDPLREAVRVVAHPFIVERTNQLFGSSSIDGLTAGNDAQLKEWLAALSRDEHEPPLLEIHLDRVVKTALLDIACRLRMELERTLELRVMPREGLPELAFEQYADAVRLLAHDLQQLGEDSSAIVKWFEQLVRMLEGRVQAGQRSLVQAGDPLHNWLGAMLRRVGLQAGDVYQSISSQYDQWREDWVMWKVAQRILALLNNRQGGALGLFDFPDAFVIRLEATAKAVQARMDEMDAELAQRERLVALGGVLVSAQVDANSDARLDIALDDLSLERAMQQAFRPQGKLRNLFRLHADTLIDDLLRCLRPSVAECVQDVAESAGTIGADRMIELAVQQLFESHVSNSGRSGMPGFFDPHTHFLVYISPDLHAQLGDLEQSIRQALGQHYVGSRVPIEIFESRLCPGVVLCRCVHALSAQEFLP